MIRASFTRSTWLRRKRAQEAFSDLERLMGDDYSVGFVLEGTAFLKNFRDALEWLQSPQIGGSTNGGEFEAFLDHFVDKHGMITIAKRQPASSRSLAAPDP